MGISLLSQYQRDVEKNGFIEDPVQLQAIQILQDLIDEFEGISRSSKRVVKPSFLSKFLMFSKPEKMMPKGCYFWGGVGRGKTYLMDLFFNTLPTERKIRLHFHRFMGQVHESLKNQAQQKNPLEKVADEFKHQYDILCFDEFFVSDITDAMLLSTLLQALMARNVVLVATSNIPPKDLYRNGLQRARFLPAIDLIEQHCHIFNLDRGIDYRLRTLSQANIFYSPLDETSYTQLRTYFTQLSGIQGDDLSLIGNSILVSQRSMEIITEHNGVLWLSFAQLCMTMRSIMDYIELSKIYHTVLLSEVKIMGWQNDDAARRFIAMVDEFYEHNVKLIMSAEATLDKLYEGGKLDFEFQRCVSRLIEMQSHDYLALEHKPN